MDLFRCESATLRTHWVLVVMDQYRRRIIGFGVHAGKIDGAALCRMFNRAIRGQPWMPNFLSSDNDPLYRFHQWQANLRALEVTEIKSVPYVPLSHPFVERLIGTVRREYLDHILFWTTADLENKLLDFRTYFNNHRTHDSLERRTPDTSVSRPIAYLRSIRWQPHCRYCTRRRWPPDSSETLSGCGIRSTSAEFQGIAVSQWQRASPIGSFPATSCAPAFRK
jgi:putative transposase